MAPLETIWTAKKKAENGPAGVHKPAGTRRGARFRGGRDRRRRVRPRQRRVPGRDAAGAGAGAAGRRRVGPDVAVPH